MLLLLFQMAIISWKPLRQYSASGCFISKRSTHLVLGRNVGNKSKFSDIKFKSSNNPIRTKRCRYRIYLTVFAPFFFSVSNSHLHIITLHQDCWKLGLSRVILRQSSFQSTFMGHILLLLKWYSCLSSTFSCPPIFRYVLVFYSWQLEFWSFLYWWTQWFWPKELRVSIAQHHYSLWKWVHTEINIVVI